MVFSHSDVNRSPCYNIKLKELHVGGDQLKVNPSVFDGRHETVLDSGTTYAYLHEPAFVPFKEVIMKKLSHLKQIRGPDPIYNDICFAGGGSDITQLPKNFHEVDMVFENGKKLHHLYKVKTDDARGVTVSAFQARRHENTAPVYLGEMRIYIQFGLCGRTTGIGSPNNARVYIDKALSLGNKGSLEL